MIRSTVKGNYIFDLENNRLVHRLPIIDIEVDGDWFGENENAIFHLAPAEFVIEPWNGYEGRYLGAKKGTNERFEYDPSTYSIINTTRIFPMCRSHFADWYSIDSKSTGENKGRRVRSTEIINIVSGKNICLTGDFKIQFAGHGYLLGRYRDQTPMSYLARLNSESGEIEWKIETKGSVKNANDERFMLKTSGSIQVGSVETGDIQDEYPINFTHNRTILTSHYFYSPQGKILVFDTATYEGKFHKIHEDGAEAGAHQVAFDLDGDTVCINDSAKGEFRIYSISRETCVYEGKLPSLDGFDDAPRCHKTGKFFSFSFIDRRGWQHARYGRGFVARAEDLKTDSLQIEHEELKASYERVSREDGYVDYRIHFVESEHFSVIYRHLSAIGIAIGEEHGFTRHYEGNAVDKEFTGLILVDLGNQKLEARQRDSIEKLCFYMAKELRWFYRAGNDPEKFIEFEPRFA